jgi:hypothetical protein
LSTSALRVIAGLHEAEQRGALADEQEHERGRSLDDAGVAPTTLSRNSVPIVGIDE